MKLAKITPAATYVESTTPFQSTTIEAHYMAIRVKDWVIESPTFTFSLHFGNIKTNPNGRSEFDSRLRHEITLTAEEVVTWENDDTILFDLVAQKLGITIVQLEDHDVDNYIF